MGEVEEKSEVTLKHTFAFPAVPIESVGGAIVKVAYYLIVRAKKDRFLSKSVKVKVKLDMGNTQEGEEVEEVKNF